MNEDEQVEQYTTETLYYQPYSGAEWVTAYNEPEWYRREGYPVKRVKKTIRAETEYLS